MQKTSSNQMLKSISSLTRSTDVGPTGNVIRGSVLDCARQPLEAALRVYDPQLYIKWNPKKLRGWGCWEIRRRPDYQTVLGSYEFEGQTFHILGFKEQNLVHHVVDVPFLNYSVIEKLKKMDTWQDSYKGKDFGKELDYKMNKALDREEEKAFSEREYNIKQYKREIRWFKDYVASGGNPAQLADYWGKQDSNS